MKISFLFLMPVLVSFFVSCTAEVDSMAPSNIFSWADFQNQYQTISNPPTAWSAPTEAGSHINYNTFIAGYNANYRIMTWPESHTDAVTGNRYAVIVGGQTSAGRTLQEETNYTTYWDFSKNVYETLVYHYEYERSNIVFLFEEDANGAVDKDTENLHTAGATKTELFTVLDNLSSVLTENDLLVFAWESHGSVSGLTLPGDDVTYAELNEKMNAISGKKIMFISACHSGAAISYLSNTNRVILTSSNSNELTYSGVSVQGTTSSTGESSSWVDEVEGWKETLHLSMYNANMSLDNDNQLSMYELFVQAAWLKTDYAQHPMIDDNGDGVASSIDAIRNSDFNDNSKDGYLARSFYLGTLQDSTHNRNTVAVLDKNIGLRVATNPSHSFVAKYDTDGNRTWLKNLSTSVGATYYGIKIGPQGNFYLAGSGLTVYKYDPQFNQLWTATGGSGSGGAMNIDSSGNVYLTTLVIPEGGTCGTGDVGVSKISSDGSVLWTQSFGTSQQDNGSHVAVDSSGQVFVVGYAGGEMGGLNETNQVHFLVKYDPDGNMLIKETLDVQGSYIAIDSNDVLYVTGRSHVNTIENISMAGGTDFVLARFDLNVRNVGVRMVGTEEGDASRGEIIFDASGNLIVAGYINIASGVNRLFLVKYDSNGNELWKKLYAPTYQASVAVDSADNIYLAFETKGDFDGHLTTEVGVDDIYLMKLDSDGNKIWTKHLGASGRESVHGLAIDSNDGIYLYAASVTEIPDEGSP